MPRTSKRMTERDFKVIKAMLDANLKGSVIATATGRSSATVGNVKKANTFEDYQAAVRAYVARYRKSLDRAAASAEVEQPVGTQETTIEDVVKVLQNINDILTNFDRRMTSMEGLMVQRTRFGGSPILRRK